MTMEELDAQLAKLGALDGLIPGETRDWTAEAFQARKQRPYGVPLAHEPLDVLGASPGVLDGKRAEVLDALIVLQGSWPEAIKPGSTILSP